MASSHDIPDSTDWLPTPLSKVAALENALHCQICKEFYDTPMITSCCHTFCSKCIRTSLSNDGKCPACRSTDQANKLRNNWALQEVVTMFIVARTDALAVARKEQEALAHAGRPGKRKRVVLDSDDVADELEQRGGRNTRRKSQRLAASQTSDPGVIEIDDSADEDADFEPEELEDDGFIECLLGCGKRMKIEAMDTHLDRCEDEKKQASMPKGRLKMNGIASSRTAPTKQEPRPQDRLSELNYSLVKDKDMRKRFAELGIPNWGAKQLLVKRHTEWVNLWNANCDSDHPRTKRELLSDLDAWERTQGGRAPSGPHGQGGVVMKKDFDGAGWANKNKDEFSRLIAAARQKRTAAPASSEVPEADKGGLPVSSSVPDDPAKLQPTGDESKSHFFAQSGDSPVSTELPTIPPNPTHAPRTDSTVPIEGPHNVPAHSSEGTIQKGPMFSVPPQLIDDVEMGGSEAMSQG